MNSNALVSTLTKIACSLAIAIGLLTIQSCRQEPIKELLIPENWAPSLAQTEEFVGSMATPPKRVDQLLLSDIGQNLAALCDARLFVAYVRLMQSLNDQEREALYSEQLNWLKLRENTAKAAVVSQGGSLAPLEYSDAFLKMTQARLAELSKQLDTKQSVKHRTEERSP